MEGRKHLFFIISIILLVSNVRNVIISEVGMGQFACFFIASVSALYIVLYIAHVLRRHIGLNLPKFLQMQEHQ